MRWPLLVSVRFASVLLASVVVTCGGCKVGPNYKAPESTMPAAFGELSSATLDGQISRAGSDRPAWVDWWTRFNDPKLNSLVDRAVAGNHELQIAAARVQEARALEKMQESRLYPSIGFSAAALATRGSGNGFGTPYGIPGESSNLFQIGFDATYEVDLFGGTRRAIEAAGAFADATEAERRSVQVTLLGEVARDYIALRALQRRLVVARTNLDDQRQTADIVQRRFNQGLAPKFDVVRSQAQVVATESAIPPLEAGIRQRIHALSVLLGQPPLALSDELSKDAPIPPVPPEVPIGLPSELLRRRPDVIRAERLLAAATAEQGVATAELFPHLILGAAAGVQSRHTDNLFTLGGPGSGFYSAGPSLDWTIFDGGRRRANIDRTKARIKEAAAAYEATVLGSLRDVESALAAYSHDQTRRGSLAALVAQDREAVRIARGQYAQGLVALLDVIEVQRNLHNAQDALAQADQTVSADLVALYKALGGGWEVDQPNTMAPGPRPEPTAPLPSPASQG